MRPAEFIVRSASGVVVAVLLMLAGCGGGGGGGGDEETRTAITSPADLLLVFQAGRPGDAESVVQSSLTLSEDPVRRTAYPGPGELGLRPLVEFELTSESISFLGNEEGVYEPAITIPCRGKTGEIIAAVDYTFTFHGSGAVEQGTTPPMLVARGTVLVLGANRAAQLLYILDPARPAQALHLEGSSLGLPDRYPDYNDGMPGGSPRAVVGIQVYTAEHGLVGLVAVDAVTGEVTEETVAAASLPRPGLSGGTHSGRVTVWTIDARSGAPLAGTAVVLSQGSLTVRTRTDASGKAVISGLARGVAYAASAGGRALKAYTLARATAAVAVLPLRAEQACADALAFGAVEAGDGDTVPVPLYVSCAQDTDACSLALRFDPAALSIAGIEDVGYDATYALVLDAALVPAMPVFHDITINNDEGWVVAGLLFDDFQDPDPTSVLPAGTARAHFLDLNVHVAGSGERLIAFTNGEEHPAGVAVYNVLSTAEGVSMRPCGKPALIVPPGQCPAVEQMAEDGGTLFALAEFAVTPSVGASIVRVTGSDEDAVAGVIRTLRTPRLSMCSDVIGRDAAGGGVLDSVGARFLAAPGAYDLEVTPLAIGEKLAVDAYGVAPASFGDAPEARERTMLFGPAGVACGIGIQLGAGDLSFVAATRSVLAEAEFPRRWDLPAMLIAEIEASNGMSAYRRWVDARAPAPARADFAFLDVPALIAPASSSSVLDATPRSAELRWQRVPGACCYIVAFADARGSELWEIIVPASANDPQTLVAPPLPYTCELMSRVPYEWTVTAIAASDADSGFSSAALDLLSLAFAEERRATCAARVLRWE